MELFIQNSNICNNKCKVCNAGFYKGNTEKFRYMNIDIFEKLLYELSLSKNINEGMMLILGVSCEPTTDPTLKDKIELIKKYGFKSTIISNGILVPQKVNEGVQPDRWTISILGGMDNLGYEYVTNIKLNDTLNTIEFLCQTQNDVVVSLTFNPYDKQICYEMINRFGKYKNISIVASVFEQSKQTPELIEEFLKAKSILDKSFKVSSSGCTESVLFNDVERCLTIGRMIIDIDFNLLFCSDCITPLTRIQIGNIINESFDDILSRIITLRYHAVKCGYTNDCLKCAEETKRTNYILINNPNELSALIYNKLK